jgi:predicted regulator of Ras-like GTPase activity (Roadblock/LC7/MglB family)
LSATESTDQKISSFLEGQYDALFDAVPGLYGVLFATADGNPVSARLKEGMERDRLSAMSSSLVALGETLAKAAEQQDSEYAIVQSGDGYIVSLRIGKRLLLSAFARKDTNIGMLLSSCRNTAEKVSAKLKPRTGDN